MDNTIKSIGILGANGFLGSNLVRYFTHQKQSITGISRENYQEQVGKQFDVLINANGNSKRFWANQHPDEDYVASVESVQKSIDDFKYQTYVFISSSDVYPDHGSPELSREDAPINSGRLEPYGLHKYQAEQLVKQLPSYLIVRCSAMVGPGLRKGVVKDILEDTPLFVAANSKLQFILTEEIARCIDELVANGSIKNDIFNCGGQGSVVVDEIVSLMEKKLKIRPDAQEQYYEMDVTKLNHLVHLKSSREYLTHFLDNIN